MVRRIATCLSLLVVLSVFWGLKLTGITLAGEAFCGKAEHSHNTECGGAGVCALTEHIHEESCYSDLTADLESPTQWAQLMAQISKDGTIKETVALVAQSQIGYTESTLNFKVDADGIRRGVTRYGQWYGNAYGDWSAMFVSFCLHYGGVEGAPANAGPEAMRLEWEAAGLYRTAANADPEVGDIVFLREAGKATANAVGIITKVENANITVVQGDLDNAVAEKQYALTGNTVLGYGITPAGDTVTPLAEGTGAACTVWLDGTDGGMSHLTGAPNTAYSVHVGDTLKLPATWTSPSKYSYKLRGWYDVSNSRYYAAGAEMSVTGNAVLYADWVAQTYDIGVFNAQVSDTVSTNKFITTHLFDYNYLFNIQSANPKVTVSGSSHSETWSMVTSGNVNYGGTGTFDFIFTDNDSGGQLNMPNSRDDSNKYHSATTVSGNILQNNPALQDRLFGTNNGFDPATGTGILGKTYLGTGDHLFQIMTNPDDEHYGYHYYDSRRNAASYNQTDQRFYVYDYLSATSDSIGGAYSDFLPLNSPYANTNGHTIGRYTYAGLDGEYNGVSHYRYDSKYSGNSNSADGVYTDYAYGMRLDIRFYLPNDPGTGGNKDLYGNDMRFEFSGDDDLWVLVDGEVALDIGGIHQIVSGSIDFTTGEVIVNGSAQKTLMDLGVTAGDHVMTVLYLERGASMSNCMIYFNLAPRFGLELKKEDVLTQKLLDGAKFTVYEDLECTEPAKLWDSEAAYEEDLLDGVLNNFKSTFTVTNGTAKLWGLGSGNTYYIKETGPPTVDGYGLPLGLIRLIVDKEGVDAYQVHVGPDADGNQPSPGYTVHGVRIDEENQMVYLTATNAPKEVVEITTVQVVKKWEDTADHSNDNIIAYLTIQDPDGTVRRIREITLSAKNNWRYIWTNLPKYDYDKMTEVQYGVEESYESGYYSTVRKITEIDITWTEWGEVTTFRDNESWLLKHAANGYLATDSTGKLLWMTEEEAVDSPLALWSVDYNSNTEKATFKNGGGWILTLSGATNSNRYFNTSKSTTNYQSFTPVRVEGTNPGFRLYVTRSNRNYYLYNLTANNGRITATNTAGSGMVLIPMKLVTKSTTEKIDGWGYQITNTPLPKSNETSLTVNKHWNVPTGFNPSNYEQSQVTVKLYANGVDTGRTVTLTLKNGWEGAFRGLPYTDGNGQVITYTVEEVWEKDRWTTFVGTVVSTGGDPPTYSVSITNTYQVGGPPLPATGSPARLLFMLCGGMILLATLAVGIVLRRKRERGSG